MMPHRGLVNLVKWQMQTPRLGPDERVSQIAAAGSQACAPEVWACLTSGASLHIANDEVCASPEHLSVWLREQGITVSSLPSSLATEVLAQDPRPAKLRLMLSVGDPLNAVPEDMAFAVLNNYSLSGYAGIATSAVIASGAPAGAIIGLPVANTEARILDSDFQQAAVGVPGGVWIARARPAPPLPHPPRLPPP